MLSGLPIIFCVAPSFVAPLCAPAKSALLRSIQAGASGDEIAASVARLEWLNPSVFTGAVASDKLPGNWLMVYTTSDSIAGKTRPKLFQALTPPEQLLDVAGGRACNSERVLGVINAVEIALKPATRNRVDVRFETFRLGPLAFPAPDLTGSLDTTYLDEDMRSGSFVLVPSLKAARAASASGAHPPAQGCPLGRRGDSLPLGDAEERGAAVVCLAPCLQLPIALCPLRHPRISRGDRDNLFVLLRESSMRETADAVWAGWRSSW